MFGLLSPRKKARKILLKLDPSYEMARISIRRMFEGIVLPSELALLVNVFHNNPCLDTAVDLIVFDPRLLVCFQASCGAVSDLISDLSLDKE